VPELTLSGRAAAEGRAQGSRPRVAAEAGATGAGLSA